MSVSEKCRNKHNNNSDNPLTSGRTEGGKNYPPGKVTATALFVKASQTPHTIRTQVYFPSRSLFCGTSFIIIFRKLRAVCSSLILLT